MVLRGGASWVHPGAIGWSHQVELGSYRSCCSVAFSAACRQGVGRLASGIRRCDFIAAGEGGGEQPGRNLLSPISGSSAGSEEEALAAMLVGCRIPSFGTSDALARRASPISSEGLQPSAVQDAAAIPFGKCCAAVWPAPVKRRRRRGGEVRVARDAYPQSPSWLPGCRRHPTLRWRLRSGSPCTLEACEPRPQGIRRDWDGS